MKSFDVSRRSSTGIVAIFRGRLLPRSETFIRSQALALERWKPVLLGRQPVDGGLDLDGLDVRWLRGNFDQDRAVHLRLLSRALHGSWAAQLRRTGARLVHAHFGLDAVDLWPAARAASLPMLVTLHGFDIQIKREWWEQGHGGDRWRTYPDRLLRLANDAHVHFVAVSKAIRARAISFGIPAERLSVQYIGVDTSHFVPGPIDLSRRPKRILFVGRLVEKKGADLLIRAFRQVRDTEPDAELVMAGDGPLRAELERLAVSMSVPVSFLGAITPDRVMDLMQSARIFCLPSVVAPNGDAEGLPIAVLEAAACGLGIVTSATGAVGEVVRSGETGLCVAEGDVQALALSIRNLLADDGLLESMARRARKLVASDFDLRARTRLLEEQYSACLASCPPNQKLAST